MSSRGTKTEQQTETINTKKTGKHGAVRKLFSSVLTQIEPFIHTFAVCKPVHSKRNCWVSLLINTRLNPFKPLLKYRSSNYSDQSVQTILILFAVQRLENNL